MSNKILVVRVYEKAEIPTVYDKDYGWTEESALENERKIAELYGDTCEFEVRPYEGSKPTNESHEWPDA